MSKKIGVYVCRCGGNISDVVDIQDVLDFAESLTNVSLVKEHENICSDEGQEMIVSDIKEEELDGVVIASCSPHFHEETFRNTLETSEINHYMLEIANIREQGSWVHYDDPQGSTAKAKAVIAGVVGKVKLNKALESLSVPIGERVLVIGAGIAGIQASLDLADAGFEVHVVEKQPSIGGRMAQLSRTFPTNDCAPCILDPKMSDLMGHENISCYTNAEVVDIDGIIGDYKVKIDIKPRYVDPNKCTACNDCVEYCPVEVEDEFNFGLSKRKAIYLPHSGSVPQSYVIDIDNCTGCGVCEEVCPVEGAVDITYPFHYGLEDEKKELTVDTIVVATGYDLYDLSEVGEYHYSDNQNVIHSGQLERMIIGTGPTQGQITRPSDGKTPNSVAFVLCSGSRDEDHCEYCSQICCMYSMKQAFLLRNKLGEDAEISIFYTDVRATGKGFEEYYNDVQEKHIQFIRGKPDEVRGITDDNLLVSVTDTLDNEVLEEEFEMVVLAPAIVPNHDTESISDMLKLSKSEDGFLKEEHPKYKPVDTSVKGVFLAGCAQGPKDIPESVTQGDAAAARVTRLINKDSIEMDPISVEVDKKLCDGCMDCVEVCPYDAIIPKDGKVKVNDLLCRGCGLCLGSCPVDALFVKNFGYDQLLAQVEEILSVAPGPKIIGFLDDTCTYEAVDLLSNRRTLYSSSMVPVRIPNGSMVTPSLIKDTFKKGAQAVYIGTCEPGSDPYSPRCAEVTLENVNNTKKLLKEAEVEEERLLLTYYVTGAPGKFLDDLDKIEQIAITTGKIPDEKRTQL